MADIPLGLFVISSHTLSVRNLRAFSIEAPILMTAFINLQTKISIKRPSNQYQMISLVLASLLLSACSSVPPMSEQLSGKVRDKFTSEVKADGLKLFTYQVWRIDQNSRNGMTSAERKVIRTQDQMNNLKKKQKQMEQQEELWQQQIDWGLSQTLEHSHFCTTGYIEIDRFIGLDRAEIRGECKEGANDLAPKSETKI